jgi:serine protease AprX
MNRLKVCLSVLFLLVVSADLRPAFTQSRHATVDDALRRTQAGGTRRQRVLIKYRPGAERNVLRSLAAHGDRVRRVQRSASLVTGEIHAEDVERLARHPGIEGLSLDAIVTAHDDDDEIDDDDVTITINTLRQTLGLTSGRLDGTGVGVAVIDSGLALSSDFSGRVRAFYDFTGGGIPTTPSDQYGHGTHVAGLIGGNGVVSGGAYTGIAPGVDLVILKALDAQGQGYTSDVINAIEFAIANKNVLGIDILNLSLGHPIYEPAASDPLVQAVERAAAAGIVVVTSAGNYGTNRETGQIGYAGITSPGNAPSAITAGAVMTRNTVSRLDDRVAPYSSRGPTWYDANAKPDFVAPGDKLVGPSHAAASLYNAYPPLREPGDYLRLSGTSMAAAVTTGTIALVLQANREGPGGDDDERDDDDEPLSPRPDLTPNAVKAILQYTALDVNDESGGPADSLTKGAGALNAASAIALARTIDTSQPVGALWLVSGVDEYTVIGDDTHSWGTHIIWGTDVSWGNPLLYSEEAWGDHIIWGTHRDAVWGDATHVTWDGDVVADNYPIWGHDIVWGEAYAPVVADGVWGDEEDHIIWGTLDPSLSVIGYGVAEAALASWPPDTRITAGPALTTTATSAAFEFSAGDPGSTFECSLDGAVPVACTSPASYDGLGLGAHTFAVRAVAPSGIADAIPVSYSWRVEPPPVAGAPASQVSSGSAAPDTIDTSASETTTSTTSDTTAAGGPPPSCPAPMTLTASADAWIDENSTSNNFGADSIMKVRSQGPRDNFRTLIRFALPLLPQGCQVQGATLTLFNASSTSGRTIHVLRVAGAWAEGNVTWNNQPATTGSPIAAASQYGSMMWGVTDLVRGMYDSDLLHGFLIRDAIEGAGGAEQSFHSREKGETPPALTITFGARSQ